MSESKDTLIKFRLARAKESLEEARTMFEFGHYYTCVNRLYYACFYAVSGLLLANDLSAVKHSGIRSLFGRHFVRIGLISREMGDLYNDLYEARQEADYVDFSEVDPVILPELLVGVEGFIQTITDLLPHDRETPQSDS